MRFRCPFERNLRQWHSWFAWHPVRLESGECAWLEWVERRGEPRWSWGEWFWYWEYRSLADD